MTEKNYLRNDLDTHVMTESKSRSFDFRRADGSSFYFFKITWSAGVISIMGDMGSLTLENWYAMPTFEKAVHWAANAELQYLLGKSNVSEEYDGKETAKSIIRHANHEVIEALNGQFWNRERRDDGMRQIAQKIRKGLLEKEELEDYDIYSFSKRTKVDIYQFRNDPKKYWDFCGVWNGWLDLWKALEDFGRYREWSDDSLKNILKPSYRREMRKAVEEACCTEMGVIDLFNHTNYDDYPIMRDYSFTNYRLAAAIRWACQKFIAEGLVPAEREAA